MALNPYDSCTCGSGKKFKWCCATFYDKVEHALDLQEQGQHESALKAMVAVTESHPKEPAVWAYYAQLLYSEERAEQAETALARAMELNPHFGFGYFLKGLFRHSEGEVIGALLLFRKAAEAFDPQAHTRLAQVYELIARNESMLNRPIASRAALEASMHYSPADQELRKQFDRIFGDESKLPLVARKKYQFRKTLKPLVVDTLAPRLTDARTSYTRMTELVPADPAAWFNLGLVHAWLGEQPAAVAALRKSVECEWDDALAEEAAAIIECLRCAQGMEDDTDYLCHTADIEIRDGKLFLSFIRTWERERKLMVTQVDEQGRYLLGIILEPMPNLLDTGNQLARTVCNFSLVGGIIRLSHCDRESVKNVALAMRDSINLAISEPVFGIESPRFADVTQAALPLPIQMNDQVVIEGKIRDAITDYFEGVWAHQAFRTLGGATPLDASGSSLMRKRLLGLIKFHEDCLKSAQGDVETPLYDFQRLRRKLDAEIRPAGPAPTIDVPADPIVVPKPVPAATAPASVPTPAPAPSPRDFGAMSAADLGLLAVDSLSSSQCDEAMRASLKLDARELAVKFAKAGVSKPIDPARTDRFPFYACLIAGAIADGDTALALKHVAEGAAFDSEHNHSRRSNEFAARKAQLHARRNEIDQAVEEYEGLVTRNPEEPKFLISAAESMLSAKQPTRALHFAEKGLDRAKHSNNRDLEAACLELSEAARKMMK